MNCMFPSTVCRSLSEVLLRKDVLKICSTCTGEHPCRSVILIKFLCNFIEITIWHGCSPVNLLHIFRTPFLKNTSDGLLLNIAPKSEKNLNQQGNTVFVFKHYETNMSVFFCEKSVNDETLNASVGPIFV